MSKKQKVKEKPEWLTEFERAGGGIFVSSSAVDKPGYNPLDKAKDPLQPSEQFFTRMTGIGFMMEPRMWDQPWRPSQDFMREYLNEPTREEQQQIAAPPPQQVRGYSVGYSVIDEEASIDKRINRANVVIMKADDVIEAGDKIIVGIDPGTVRKADGSEPLGMCCVLSRVNGKKALMDQKIKMLADAIKRRIELERIQNETNMG